jgi:hypothetical protein
MAPFQDEMTAAPIAPREQLRVFRAKDPYIALGLAVSHLMTKPAFANLRFGDWSRILTGQIIASTITSRSTARIRFRDSWAGP